MPKPYLLDLCEPVVRYVNEGHSRRAAAAHRRLSLSFVVNLVKAFRVRGSLAPKPSGGHRHAKLERHRAFHLEKVGQKADITMPELAAELAAATCEKVNPASLSRWLIRIGYRFKTYGPRRSQEGLSRLAADQSASTSPASEVSPRPRWRYARSGPQRSSTVRLSRRHPLANTLGRSPLRVRSTKPLRRSWDSGGGEPFSAPQH
jgi:transposase